MPYKIISPTGVSVTKTLTDELASKLKAEKYFQVVAAQDDDPFTSEATITIHRAPQEECQACSA